MSEKLKMRPYARLITMLGDQLIKNERIALAELIKNSYDADADWVKVSFINFNDDFAVNGNSKIIIEDDGCGMNREIIEKHWLNPATPEKAKQKKVNPKTEKGRIIQGEKGIGRFAAFKLGKKIDIYTRRRLQDEDGSFTDLAEPVENYLSYDFSEYDEDFVDSENGKTDLYIDELDVNFEQRVPSKIVSGSVILGNVKRERKPYGTIIEISSLKTNWTVKRVEGVKFDIDKLLPIFSDEGSEDFSVYIYKDDVEYSSQYTNKDKLLDCLANKSVLKVTDGTYSQKKREFSFYLNNEFKEISFEDLKGLEAFKSYFCDANGKPDVLYQTVCGDFHFQFYIFDFGARDEKYKLDTDEEKLVKDHRIYLYRDHIRVLPYGDPDDDWLKIDMMRGTQSASYYLSNDQIVGCVDISQAENPNLRDKTNREGLIDEGQAVQDFLNLLQVLLRYLRKVEYTKYLIDKKKRKDEDDLKAGKPLEQIQKLKKNIGSDSNASALLATIEKSYKKEMEAYNSRIEIVENLAAVGLSVEIASHDVMIILNKVLDQVYQMTHSLMDPGEIDKKSLLDQMILVWNNLDIVQTQMRNIRLLFPAGKKRATNLSVKDSLDKVYQLYQSSIKKNEINVRIDCQEHDFTMKATESSLLQVFVNLFDNALYWLKTINTDRNILIVINNKNKSIIFADNGPGVKEESVPYIFEAFYSEKGEDGRGLGLYITRQLLSRYDYDITLLTDENEKILSGANFYIACEKD